MTTAQKLLWEKIRRFELDDPAAAYSFSDRLARENGWSLGYTLRCIEEYKKFMFLICVTEHPLSPSDAVDQVWHLHLLYTWSYWNDFCQNTLQRPVHHGPTKGGTAEQHKFSDWYSKTLEAYSELFRQVPPAAIWPAAAAPVKKQHFRRVDLHRHWVLKKLF